MQNCTFVFPYSRDMEKIHSSHLFQRFRRFLLASTESTCFFNHCLLKELFVFLFFSKSDLQKDR